MPLNGTQYTAPTWVNKGKPAISADELNAISTALANLNPAIVLKDGVLQSLDGTDQSETIAASLSKFIGGHVAQDNEPENTGLLWIDTGNGGILKYHDGTSWVAVSSVWG